MMIKLKIKISFPLPGYDNAAKMCWNYQTVYNTLHENIFGHLLTPTMGSNRRIRKIKCAKDEDEVTARLMRANVRH